MSALQSLDARGHPTTKLCPNCRAVIGRSAPTCRQCGHEFISYERQLQMRKAAGEIIVRGRTKKATCTPGSRGAARPGPKPRFNPDAPETDSAIDRLIGLTDARRAPTAHAIPADGGFVVHTHGEALTLIWNAWDVFIELTAEEAAAVRKALA